MQINLEWQDGDTKVLGDNWGYQIVETGPVPWLLRSRHGRFLANDRRPNVGIGKNKWWSEAGKNEVAKTLPPRKAGNYELDTIVMLPMQLWKSKGLVASDLGSKHEQ